ncbi:hypothetical protein QQ045_004460 [Rhodiola kirilowii]
MWMRHDFKDVVRDAWRSQSSDLSLSEKLEHCMKDLNHWGSTFGNVKKKIKDLKENIQCIRAGPRTEEMARLEAKLSEKLDE